MRNRPESEDSPPSQHLEKETIFTLSRPWNTKLKMIKKEKHCLLQEHKKLVKKKKIEHNVLPRGRLHHYLGWILGEKVRPESDQAFGSSPSFRSQKTRDVFSDTGSANAFGTIQYGDRLESTTRPAHQQIHSKKGEEEEDPCRRIRLKRDISQWQGVDLVWTLIWVQLLKNIKRYGRKWGHDLVSVDESYFLERPSYTDPLPFGAPLLWDWMESSLNVLLWITNCLRLKLILMQNMKSPE